MAWLNPETGLVEDDGFMRDDAKKMERVSDSAQAAGSVSCRADCALGDEGHCGRTEREFLHHCEKRFNEKRPQRGEWKQND